MSSLVISVALWGHRPPEHTVTSLLLLHDQCSLATGCASGQVCLWGPLTMNVSTNTTSDNNDNLDSSSIPLFSIPTTISDCDNERSSKSIVDPSLPMPKMLLYGHQCHITALSECTYQTEASETTVVASADAEGSLYVWDTADGRCLQSARNVFPGTPTALEGIAGRRKLVCCGHFTEIIVIDVATLQPLISLASLTEPNWIAGLCVCGIINPDGFLSEALFAVSMNGVLKVWLLEDLEELQAADAPVAPIRIMHLNVDGILSIRVNPFNHNTTLIVTACEWLVYFGNDFKLLCSLVCPFRLGWAGGSFISEHEVLVWGKDGNGYLYRLPEFTTPLLSNPSHISPIPNANDTENVQKENLIRKSLIPGKSATSISPLTSSPAPSFALQKVPSVGNISSVSGGELSQETGIPRRSSLTRDLMNLSMHRLSQESNSCLYKVPSPLQASLMRIYTRSTDVPTETVTSMWESSSSDLQRGGFPMMAFRAGTQGINQSRLVCIDGAGKITVWSVHLDGDNVYNLNVDSESDVAVNENDSCNLNELLSQQLYSSVVKPGQTQVCVPAVESNFTDLWRRCGSSNGHIIGMDCADTNEGLPSSSMLVNGTILVQGYSSGLIEVLTLEAFCHDLVYGRSHVNAQSPVPPNNADCSDELLSSGDDSAATDEIGDNVLRHERIRVQCHSGVVSCLLYPFQQPIRRARVFVSGGHDFAVRVWNLDTCEQLHSFYQHGGPIVSLSAPFNLSNTRLKYCVMSIAMDHSVCIFSLDLMHCLYVFAGHPHPIASVKWRLADDFCLIQLIDETVYIWQMESGELDRIVSGQVSEDVLSCCDDIDCSGEAAISVPSTYGNMRSSIPPIPPTRSADDFMGSSLQFLELTTLPGCSNSDPRVVVVVFDVKRLINELYRVHNTIRNFRLKRRSSQRISLDNNDGSSGDDKDESITANIFYQKQLFTVASVCLSFLLCWGLDERLDVTCENVLGLHRPSRLVSFGVRGSSNTGTSNNCRDFCQMSICVTGLHDGFTRWPTSDHVTAIHAISIVGLAKTFMTLGPEDQKAEWSNVVTFYCAFAPDMWLEHGRCASIITLVRYWQDPQADTQQAARSLILHVIHRLQKDERRNFIKQWSPQLPEYISSETQPNVVVEYTDTGMRTTALMVLAIVGAEYPDSLSSDIAANVAGLLLHILMRNTPASEVAGARQMNLMAAAELLGKGFSVWEPHINMTVLLARLIELSFPVNSVTGGVSPAIMQQTKMISRVAKHALALIATCNARVVVSIASNEVSNSGLSAIARLNAIRSMITLVRKKPLVLVEQVLKLVEIVVKALDPSTPALRDSCIQDATTLMQELIKHFIMISFHGRTQKLAVGTPDGVVIVYDLRTATRWQVFESHNGPITALAFSTDGRLLATYAVADQQLCFWQTSASFFGMLGSAAKCVHRFDVAPTPPMSLAVLMESVRLVWVSDKRLVLLNPLSQDFSV